MNTDENWSRAVYNFSHSARSMPASRRILAKSPAPNVCPVRVRNANRLRALLHDLVFASSVGAFKSHSPAFFQGTRICPYPVEPRYGSVMPAVFHQFVFGAAHSGQEVFGEHDPVLPDLRGAWMSGTPLR